MCPVNITGSGCMKHWRTDGNIKTRLPAVSKSVGGRFSWSRLSHLHRVLAKKKKLQVPFESHAGQCARGRSASTLTLPVNSDMCVRRWRTAGRKISCCLNKRDQRDAGSVWRREGWGRGWLTHVWQRYAEDVVLLTESWNGVDKATECTISSRRRAAL